MQLMEYPDSGLGKLKLKKVFKKIGRGLKKIGKPLAHIGAAVATGGASLAVSAQMLQAKQARKTDAAMAQAQAAMMVAPAASPFEPIQQRAPTADSVRRRLPMPTVPTRYAPEESFGPPESGAGSQSGTPNWLIPAVLAGGVALLVLTQRKSS